MRRVKLSRDARKAIKKLPPKHARQVAEKIQALIVDPEPHDSQELKGKHAPKRRADSGEYRIIYEADEKTLFIFLVGKRNDSAIYRALKRKPR